MALLEANGIATDEQRGYHILWSLAQEALICCGPMQDQHQTFVLLDEWVPPGTREAGLALGRASPRPPRREVLHRPRPRDGRGLRLVGRDHEG